MNGSTKKMTERETILDAMKAPPVGGYFVWDGVDEGDRPATEEELRAGIEAARRGRGRPAGSDKTQITLRVDNDTLASFRTTGKGWQSRMNEALREWLKTHSHV